MHLNQGGATNLGKVPAMLITSCHITAATRKAQTALEPIAEKVFFSGVYGFTVGAKFPPSWIEGSVFSNAQEKGHFQQNMVFHLPLCLRAPGQWGIGFSETIVVGANGAYPICKPTKLIAV